MDYFRLFINDDKLTSGHFSQHVFNWYRNELNLDFIIPTRPEPGAWVGEIMIFGEGFWSRESIIQNANFNWNSFARRIAQRIKEIKRTRNIRGMACTLIRSDEYNRDILETAYLCLDESNGKLFTNVIDRKTNTIDNNKMPIIEEMSFWGFRNVLGEIMDAIGF